MTQKSLHSFFNPQKIAVVGVSQEPHKLGSQIFKNIIDSKFRGKLTAINPKHGNKELFNQPCLTKISDTTEPFDLVIIVVPAKYTKQVINDCVINKTKNIIIISAGFGEVGNHQLEDEIQKQCQQNNINLLGPNCLGVIFPYANLNASFADGYPQKGDICFVSQSGAFCTAILDWADQQKIGFSHFISLGNKSDLSEDQILKALINDEKVKIFAFYLESIQNGPAFIRLIKQISAEKPVIILEPGSSEKAAQASASHTGSLAPNYKVLQAAYKAAGAIQVKSMQEMFNVISLLDNYEQNVFHGNLAVLTNAGGVGVLTTDLVQEAELNLVDLSNQTQHKLQQVLPAEANIKNPIDIIGDARSQRYEQSLEILINAKEVDEILVLLTPQAVTEIQKTAEIITHFKTKTNKPIIPCFIGGTKIQPALEIFKKHKISHFNFPEEATNAIKKITHRNQNTICQLFDKTPKESKTLKDIITKSRGKTALNADQVQTFLDHYQLDSPQTSNLEADKIPAALDFAKSKFPRKIVAKLISEKLLHKTDQKAVILNIQDPNTLKKVWKNFQEIITKNQLSDAKIQLQEQITPELEVIAGINTDENFGKTLLFGTGGIYTEIWQDTSLRIIPLCNQKCFKNMIAETKIGHILQGTRGKSFPINKVQETLQKIQQISLDFPEIKSIDFNPILITQERVICVDMKIILKNNQQKLAI